MTTSAKGTFEIESWDEKPYAEPGEGVKLTRAEVKERFSGDLEGAGSSQSLMCYRADGTATYVGLQLIEGSVGGRAGSFVLQVDGGYDGTNAKATWTVVTGSATGELTGLEGSGGFSAPPGSTAEVTLDYDLPNR